MKLIMNDSPDFEVRITTSETGSILRAATEREMAAKAETLLRRVCARGELISFIITGSNVASNGRLKSYFDDVLNEMAHLRI